MKTTKITPSEPIGIKPINTLCPKQGMWQWTCSYEECNCHLKETIERKQDVHNQTRNLHRDGVLSAR